MPTPDDDIKGIVSLAMRYVRTAEGAALYGKPIGTKIGEADSEKNAQDRPVTIERLLSLRRQFEAARKVGHTQLMKQVQARFQNDLRKYRKENPNANMLNDLGAAGGRQAQDADKES